MAKKRLVNVCVVDERKLADPSLDTEGMEECEVFETTKTDTKIYEIIEGLTKAYRQNQIDINDVFEGVHRIGKAKHLSRFNVPV